MTVREDKQQVINFLGIYWAPRMCWILCIGDTEMDKTQFAKYPMKSGQS